MSAPFRPINEELLAGLELASTKIYPLPGATGRRVTGGPDPRLAGLTGQTPVGDEITYYEHIATIRDAKQRRFFVAFRETMDAFLARQPDVDGKFPEWLMKSPEKQAERQIFVHLVVRKPTAVMTSHEQWLAPIVEDERGTLFDTLAHFLHREKVITDAVYRSMR